MIKDKIISEIDKKSLLTLNLYDKLLEENANKNNELENNDLVLKEAENIIKGCEDRDLSILKSAGAEYYCENIEKANKTQRLYESHDKNHIFHIDDIRSMCIKYHLRFLPFKYYKGTIDPTVPSKISKYQNEHETEKTRNYKSWLYPFKTYWEDKYYIMAPASSFNLSKKPKDPLLFVELDNEHYYLIAKWGNDLSIFRRFLGMIHDFKIVFSSCILLTIISFILLNNGYTVFGVIGSILGFCSVFATSLLKISEIAFIPKWRSSYL
jgi:hypothetical protein